MKLSFPGLAQDKKIPVTRIKVNPNKAQSAVEQFKSMCAADPDIKHLAQKVRSDKKDTRLHPRMLCHHGLKITGCLS